MASAARAAVSSPDRTSRGGLRHFDVHQVWRMELIPVSKEARLDPRAESGLQEELQHRSRIDHDHADSRSPRMTVAAVVFSLTRVRLWILLGISSRMGRAATRLSSAVGSRSLLDRELGPLVAQQLHRREVLWRMLDRVRTTHADAVVASLSRMFTSA